LQWIHQTRENIETELGEATMPKTLDLGDSFKESSFFIFPYIALRLTKGKTCPN